MSRRFPLFRHLALAAGLVLAVALSAGAVLSPAGDRGDYHDCLAEWFVLAEPGRGGRGV